MNKFKIFKDLKTTNFRGDNKDFLEAVKKENKLLLLDTYLTGVYVNGVDFAELNDFLSRNKNELLDMLRESDKTDRCDSEFELKIFFDFEEFLKFDKTFSELFDVERKDSLDELLKLLCDNFPEGASLNQTVIFLIENVLCADDGDLTCN